MSLRFEPNAFQHANRWGLRNLRLSVARAPSPAKSRRADPILRQKAILDHRVSLTFSCFGHLQIKADALPVDQDCALVNQLLPGAVIGFVAPQSLDRKENSTASLPCVAAGLSPW